MNLREKDKTCKIMTLFTLISFYIISFITIFFSIKNKDIYAYTFTSYLLTYEKGFISRGLIGTIYSFLFNDNNLFQGVFYTTIILNIILLGWFLSNITKLFFKYINQPLFNFYVVLSFCSFPIFYFFNPTFLGRIEIFWYLGFVFILWCFKDLTTLKTFMIFILSAICILIHHGFLFLIAPFVCILFLEQNKKKEFLLYGFFMIFIFLICQFMGKVDYNIMYNYVFGRIDNSNIYFSKTDIKEIESMLKYEFKLPVWKHFKIYKPAIPQTIFITIMYMFFNIINIFSIKKILNEFYHISKRTVFYIGIIIISLTILFYFTLDWNRWLLLFLLNLQFFLFFKLKNDPTQLDTNLKNINKSNILFLPIMNIFSITFLIIIVFYF